MTFTSDGLFTAMRTNLFKEFETEQVVKENKQALMDNQDMYPSIAKNGHYHKLLQSQTKNNLINNFFKKLITIIK